MIKLFDEFDPVSRDEWLSKAIADMKGENPLERFRKEIADHLFQLPYYDQSDLGDLEYTNISSLMPDREYNAWWNTAPIKIEEESAANLLALNALNNGATGLHFIAGQTSPDLTKLLKDIKLPYCYISFENFVNRSVLNYLIQQPSNTEASQFNIGLISQSTDHKTIDSDQEIFSLGIVRDLPLFIGNKNPASLIKNIAEQLSYFVDIVCKANEGNVQNLFDRVIIVNTCQNHYFLEIAKLRAIRVLFAELGSYFGLESPKIFIQSTTNTGNDQLENLLINTTQAMSALSGGTDSMVIHPHIKEPADNEQLHFTLRIARNVSNLLEEESHFGKVKDPSAGSYYICSLTDQIVRKTWDKFREMEELGGFSKLKERIA